MRRPGNARGGLPRLGRKAELGELSSTSSMLHGMRMPGGRFPGESVIQAVHKSAKRPNERFIVYYGGKIRRTSKRSLARMVRDRAFDLSHQRFVHSTPLEQQKQLAGSVQFQKRAKAAHLTRLREKLGKVKSAAKKARLTAEIERFRRIRPRSPHTGAKPISAHIRRWA